MTEAELARWLVLYQGVGTGDKAVYKDFEGTTQKVDYDIGGIMLREGTYETLLKSCLGASRRRISGNYSAAVLGTDW